MVGLTDQRTTATGKIASYSFQQEWALHAMQGHTGKHQVSQKAEVGENHGKNFFLWCHGKEWTKQGNLA
jgi:hypothetical protein